MGGKLPDEWGRVTVTLDGVVYTASVAVTARGIVSSGEWGRAEWSILREAASRGHMTPAVFKFARKSLGLKSRNLAKILGTAPETVTRWEKGQRRLPRTAFIAIMGMVCERLRGESTLISIAKAIDTDTEFGDVVEVVTEPEAQMAPDMELKCMMAATIAAGYAAGSMASGAPLSASPEDLGVRGAREIYSQIVCDEDGEENPF